MLGISAFLDLKISLTFRSIVESSTAKEAVDQYVTKQIAALNVSVATKKEVRRYRDNQSLYPISLPSTSLLTSAWPGKDHFRRTARRHQHRASRSSAICYSEKILMIPNDQNVPKPYQSCKMSKARLMPSLSYRIKVRYTVVHNDSCSH